MKLLMFLCLTLLSVQASAIDFHENIKIKNLFVKAGLEGTFVLYDLHAKTYSGHNADRANIRYFPASTFKVANSLIGLSVGAVSSVDEILPYGGGPQYLKIWEKDMSLRDAIKISNVPIFQELARRIGRSKMQKNVVKLGYGNQRIGNNIDTFWLRGPIAISAIEQTGFLARLAVGALPYPQKVQKSVREIVELERDEDWVLYGKTGFSVASDPQIGWWVGWVKRENRIYSFALNVDVQKAVTKKRIELGKASLRILGIL